jgi:hypothetical protein
MEDPSMHLHSKVTRALLGPLLLLCAAGTAVAQACPPKHPLGWREAPDTSILRGTLIHHDELRTWLGLKLDKPACGQTEMELVFGDSMAWRRADSLRGCLIGAVGKLYYSPTGYYSADMALSNARLKPDTSCHPLPVKRDPSTMAILPGVSVYRVSITVDYRGKGHVAVRVWNAKNSRLIRPWEAYADYRLTGRGDGIWLQCRESFVLQDPAQSPPSDVGIFQDEPDLTGTVLQDVNGANVITFACRREARRQ